MATTTAKHIRRAFAPPALSASAMSTAAMLALLFSSCVHAAEWKFTPTIGLEEIYTDNLRLTPVGTERSEFITQVSPGFILKGSGRQLQVNAQYEMQNLHYARQGGGITTQHQFSGDAHAELLQNLFFLNGKAQVSQQTISPFGPQSTSTVNLNSNRTEVRTYSISPYLQHRFGSTASTVLRYTHDAVSTDTGGLLDSQTDGIFFGLNSGPAFRTFVWGINYSQRHTDYDNANSLKTEETSASLQYLLTPRFSLTASAGYEKNNYVSLSGEQPAGRFWTSGFSWAPSARTSIAASAGHRFYGKTFSLLANHRSRNTVWSMGYNDDITTTNSQFSVPATTDTSTFLNDLLKSSFPDKDERQQAVDALILSLQLPGSMSYSINTLTNRVFLQKHLQASVALKGAKNTLLLSLFNMRRTAQTAAGADAILLGTGNLAREDNTRQLGANALWNWQITSRTNASVGVGYTRGKSLGTSLTTDTRSLRMGLSRQFQPKLKGTLEYRRLQQDFNQPGRDVRENAVTAGILMAF